MPWKKPLSTWLTSLWQKGKVCFQRSLVESYAYYVEGLRHANYLNTIDLLFFYCSKCWSMPKNFRPIIHIFPLGSRPDCNFDPRYSNRTHSQKAISHQLVLHVYYPRHVQEGKQTKLWVTCFSFVSLEFWCKCREW